MNSKFPLSILYLALLSLAHGHARGELVFFDDFADGDHLDDQPASWISAESDLTIVGSGLSVFTPGTYLQVDVDPHLELADASVRTRITIHEGETFGIAARAVEGNNYYGFLSTTGVNGIGIEDHFINGPFQNDLSSEVLLQFDVIGGEISFWAWPADALMPDEPLATATDQTIDSGSIFLWAQSCTNIECPEDSGPVRADIRFVEVAESQLRLGDFNHDDLLDIEDVNLLHDEILGENNSLRMDLDGNELVDSNDLVKWISEIKDTWVGDANLDGEFNTGDFVDVFQNGEYEDLIEGNSTWNEGDWNGDGDFTSGDFVIAFRDGGYELGPKPNIRQVPEPRSVLLCLFACLVLVRPRIVNTALRTA